MYNLLGNVNLNGCNNIVSPEIESNTTRPNLMSMKLDSTRGKSVQIDSTRHNKIDLTRLWHKRMGHIG
jgi:hypothetical protein